MYFVEAFRLRVPSASGSVPSGFGFGLAAASPPPAPSASAFSFLRTLSFFSRSEDACSTERNKPNEQARSEVTNGDV